MNRLYPSVGAWASRKETFLLHFGCLAGLLGEALGCPLVSPANEATLIFQF